MTRALKLTSYNILADAHIRPEWYPQTPDKLLWWEHRKKRLVSLLNALDSDVMCLQEVEPKAFEFLKQTFQPKGYRGIYAQKGGNKPDGCAIFFKSTKLSLRDYQTIYYSDAARSGHLVLIAEFEFDDVIVKVANTHLKWESRESNHRIGSEQAKELASIIGGEKAARWIVCGDFNAQPESAIVKLMLAQGLCDAYAVQPQPTCNSSQEAKRIDYIFHSQTMTAKPAQIAAINDQTPLPSETEPSDHLAVSAILSFNPTTLHQ